MSIVKKVEFSKTMPKIYERIALEEYYKYYQQINRDKPIFYRDVHFATQQSKLSDKDMADQSLFHAINTVGKQDKEYAFALALGEEDDLQGIMRYRLIHDEEIFYIYDIIFTNYPNGLEKLEILNDFLAKCNEEKVVFEGFIQDDVITKYFLSLGFSFENHGKGFVTMKKDLLNREENGPTLCRK